jgi:hypothetical protein
MQPFTLGCDCSAETRVSVDETNPRTDVMGDVLLSRDSDVSIPRMLHVYVHVHMQVVISKCTFLRVISVCSLNRPVLLSIRGCVCDLGYIRM